MPGRMEFEFRFATAEARRRTRPGGGAPFRMLVLGDFRGSAGKPSDPVEGRTVPVDVDNLDAVFARMAPALEIPGGEGDGGESVPLRSLDDFHPDALHARLGIFRDLRTLRAELLDPATFPAAMARLVGESRAATPAAASGAGVAKESEPETIERLLGRPASGGASGAGVDITGLLKQVVAPYIVAARDSRTDSLVASVDSATAALMRTLLRSSAFRSLEATWRGLHRLVTSEACGEGVEIHLLHASRAGVEADLLANARSLERSALARALAARAEGPGGAPWSLMIGAYDFGPDEASLRLLTGLGTLARHAGGPFLAGAQAALLGLGSFAEMTSPSEWAPLPAEAAASWSALRQSPGAPHVALAAPRVLMRQPYGRNSDPVERFAFEEVPPGGDHESLPWGHPGFALAELLAASFGEHGFEMEPGDQRDLTELPSHTSVVDGETVQTPCAEVFLAERSADAMIERGITPIVSVRNRAAVVVPRFQSIADPPAPLAGPWS